MKRFIGRKKEITTLSRLKKKKSASLVVIRGRRRVGKSRLAEEFGTTFPKSFIFSGIHPTPETTSQSEKDEFANQLYRYKIPTLKKDDWGDLLWSLSQYCQNGPVLIILDEISWIASKDPLFLGKLKIIWDLHFSKNPQCVVILSGSNSTWIDKNILSSTGFVGHISNVIDLKELPLEDCAEFWNAHKNKIASYEKFKLLSVTGGIPRYLEEMDPNLSAEANIRDLCFQPGGLLFNEFEQIFSDFFSRRGSIYKELLQHLIQTPLTIPEIAKKYKRARSGDFSEYLEDLCLSGFLSRDYTWTIKRGKISKLSRFRVSDNYIRFYLKHIEPNRQRILNQEIEGIPANWHSVMGLQFENLVINNRQKLFDLLHIPREEIIAGGPYFQNLTKTHAGCQIDILIQTRFNLLYACEIKFSTAPVPHSIIQEMENKIKALKLPRGFSVRPILIHVNGCCPSVEEEGYFAQIIDFGQFLD